MSPYIRNFALHCLKKGYRAVAVNWRGCHDTPLLTSRPYSIVSSSDVHDAIQHVHKLYPNSPLIGIGYSLGSNLLSKYLGEVGDDTPLMTGIGFANPHDFHLISEYCDAPLVKYSYNRRLANNLVNFVKRHEEVLGKDARLNLEEIKKCTDMRQVDERFMIKVLDFPSVKHYYQEGSSRFYVPNIKIPYLICNALDDPLIPVHSIGYEECRRNENVVLALTRCGGHLGWFEGLLPWSKTWADRVALEWIEAVSSSQK